MKKFNLIFILFFVFILIASCAKKATSYKKFTLKIGSLQTGLPLSGGSFVRAIQGNTKIFTKLDANDSAEFPTGIWEFQTVSFEGPGPYAGKRYCGRIQNVKIDSSEANIALTINESNCLSEPFISLIAEINNNFNNNLALTILNLSPNAGATAGLTTVTVNGTGFVSGATVDVGGSNCTAAVVVNPTTITCTLPPHSQGVVHVIVTNPNTESATALNTYTYQPAPTVGSISPTSGTTLGGTFVTINGTGFLAGATASFDGANCHSLSVLNPTTLTCITPAHSSGPVTIVVYNSDGQIGNAVSAYTYESPPSVTINQAVTETIGSCSFIAPSDPSSVVGFAYKVIFSKVINPATFTTSDISNIGTGGATNLTWALTNCGDNINFKLEATAISGYGTIIPIISSDILQDTFGINNLASSSTDNSVTYLFMGWYQEAFIKAANNDLNDLFGSALSLSGDTLVVGASNEDSNQITITNGVTASSDNSSLNSGAVYVYKRSGVNWSQEAYIKAANNDPSDLFGSSISLSGDTLVVGASAEDSNQITITNGATASSDNSSLNSGAVYVYKRSGLSWSQEAYIKAANNDPNDSFGTSVSLNEDTLVVGARDEDSNQTTITNGVTASSDNSSLSSGAVYIYKRSGVSWSQEAYVKASNSGANDYFGPSISLSGDSLAIGAYKEDSNATTITNGLGFSDPGVSSDSGAVYIYKRSGTTWSQEAYVKAINNGAGDYFGYSASISGDTLAVAAYNEDSSATTITNGSSFSDPGVSSDSGAVYVYKRSGVSWSQEAYIKAVNNDPSDFFGFSVSLSGDTLVVGASNEDSNQITITNGVTASSDNSNTNSGAIYIYRNNARLFPVTEIFPVITSNSISLKWHKTGGTAVGYGVNIDTGIVTPTLCSTSMDYDLGDANEVFISSLTANTDYSLRFCVYDSSNQFLEDKIINLKTNL